jgi:hypothetical protein
MIGMIFNQRGSRVGDVAFDAVVRETYTSTAIVTRHPVEQGADITDHVREEPDGLSLEGVISNTPTATNLLGGGTPQVPSPTRAESAYGALFALKEAREPVTVYTSKNDYEDMVITSLERTRDAPTGDSVIVSMKFEKIRVVESREVDAPVRPPNVQKPKKTLGKKPKAPEPPAERGKSVALKLWEGI